MLLLACALPFGAAVAGHAQESRQDFSISGAGLFPRDTNGNAVQQRSTIGDGLVASYRYMATPHVALEGNYGWDRITYKFNSPGNVIRVHTQFQEFSAGLVYSAFAWKNFYPFAEAGVGGYLFGIVNDIKTDYTGLKSNTNIGFLYGAGTAYELSPSWDIRVEYRGIYVKAPNFGAPSNFTNTGRYSNITNPVVGVAYHF
jgi:outer membrane immunogenic protein